MADRALLEQILAEQGIRTAEEPSAVAYGEYLLDQLGDLFGLPSDVLERLVTPSELVLWLLVISIPPGLLWIFRQPLRDLLSRLLDRAPAAPQAEALPAPPPDPRARLERCLAAGDAAGALAALWLVVACGLSSRGLGRFEAEMTNREFVDSVRTAAPSWPGLAALAALARRLDTLLYGGVPPTVTGARELAAEAEGLLALAAEGPP